MDLARFLTTRWLPAVASTIRPSTHSSYEGHVRLHVTPYIGEIELGRLAPADLNDLYARLLASGRVGGGGLSPATVRRVHAMLHRALKDAARWGLIASSPAEGADPPRIGARAPELMATWSGAELARFLRDHRRHRFHRVWLLLAMTGMRRGEALGLRWSDVDFGRRQVAVRQTIVSIRGRIEVSSPKTARGRRVIALDARTARSLATLHKRSSGSGLVFHERGQPFDPIAVTKEFSAAVAASGLARIRLHDLRHTHATLALHAGVHPKIVSERLGHSTVAFTLDVYSHAIPHMQTEAAAQIAAQVFGRSGA